MHGNATTPNQSPDVEFVLETDQAPEFWQFLNGLRGDDLLVELIVNELDARSLRTEISFEADRLVCLGQGEPVDSDGWARLRKLKGAGHDVKAKSGLFGVKNHGLKACFTLGDHILVRSSGLQILQTLFANGDTAPAYPGVRVPPLPDPEAPSLGTQIEVAYRRRAFEAQQGEALSFPAVTDDQIRARFEDALETLPKRLLGIIRPGILDSYTLVLSHHALGRWTFKFGCGRPKRDKQAIVFSRHCHRLGADGVMTLLNREQVVLAPWSPPGGEKSPRFFQAGSYRVNGKPVFPEDSLVVEAAWAVDRAGRLKVEKGRLRYPVAYPGEVQGVLTGMAVHYSGPFVSATERHGLAEQASNWNNALIEACDEALFLALNTSLLPRHGARALELAASLQHPQRLQDLTERLLKARAFPAVDSRGAVMEVKRGARLVVPTYVNAQSQWSARLAAVAPPRAPILDPKTPSNFVALLAAGKCAGWRETHLRFDEVDVIDRMCRPDAEHFPWRNEAEWRSVLGHANASLLHLDALQPFLAEMASTDRPSGADVRLPDIDGKLHPLSIMKRGASIPAELVGLDVPPIVHPSLKTHPVFTLKGWQVGSYSLREVLQDGVLSGKSIAVRKRFFIWLTKNAGEVARDDWPAIKAATIWPATDGSLQSLERLCEPSPKLTQVLTDHILRPVREVRRFCASALPRRAQLKLRTDPTVDEVIDFYRAKISAFPSDQPLTAGELLAFHMFEAGLAELTASRTAVRALRSIADDAVALNLDGVLRPVRDLVRESPDVERLHLARAHLIDRQARVLDKLLPPANQPTARMALDSLRLDPGRTDSLLPRLKIITGDHDPGLRDALKRIPCIPWEGKLRAPIDLAFKGNQGDFWGNWKVVIGVAGLADDAQDLYRAAGVVRSYPTPETSRAFFEWLKTQPAGAVNRNLDQVIRHVAHKNGVGAWLLQPPEVPCIPVEGGGGAELLTLSNARRFAAVDDFAELAAALKGDQTNINLRLVVNSVKAVTHPIGDQVREWGVPTLSSLAQGPLNAVGAGQAAAPPIYLDRVHELTAATAGRRFRKQLHELDVPQTLLESQFQGRLKAIRRIVLAKNVAVHFKIRKRSFFARRPWAVLEDEIWLDADGDMDDLIVKAIADIVFVKPRPRYLSAILKAALAEPARDFVLVNDEPAAEWADAEPLDDDLDESIHRHPGGQPDPARNNPNPGALHTGGGGVRNSGASKTRPQVIDEDIQRRQLKAEHYAYHCQFDLATRSPAELAPLGSYVEFAENRRKIMEAHHPDKVSSSGSRHAGNLLILSRLSHEKIGTRLTRAEITDALQHGWMSRTILTTDGAVWLDGGIAGTTDKVTGEALPLFFTNEHRAYWLKMAGVKISDEEGTDQVTTQAPA